ncbi:MAG: ribosome small subunit-dependent GTPase A [bacterium]
MKQKETNYMIARVIAQYRGKYKVARKNKEFWAEVAGKMIFAAESTTDYPVVGDIIKIEEIDGNHAIIQEILPRKTILQRKASGKDDIQPIAANIDVAFIVQAVDRDFNLNRFDRYLVLIKGARIEPIIILNKIDLISQTELDEKIAQIKDRFHNIEILTTSVTNQHGIKELQNRIKNGKVYCFVGSSGVGKSSIINDLLGKELIKTREVSASTKKGKHTTAYRELFILRNGGMVIDNPGIREVGITSASDAVTDVFNDIAELARKCKFDNCQHMQEPGCAVLFAVKSGALSKDKYLNYIKLKKESAYYSLSSIEKKQKERDFGRLVKNFKKLKNKGK